MKKEKICLLDLSYTEKEGNSYIVLTGRKEDGKVVKFLCSKRPYLYALPRKSDDKIKEKILEINEPEITGLDESKRKIGDTERKFFRIYTKKHSELSNLRHVLKDFEEIEDVFEYSINFYKRFLLDNDFVPGDWIEIGIENGFVDPNKISKIEKESFDFKSIAFDIETYQDEKETKIIMVSFFGKKLKKVVTYKKGNFPDYVEQVENEKSLLERFSQIISEEDPDIIYGYNSDLFDFKVIRERSEKNKIELKISRDGTGIKFKRRTRSSSARINGRVHIDIFNFVSRVIPTQLQTEVLSLSEVSKEILKDQKIDMKMEDIQESWRKGRIDKLAEYSLKDSELTFRLGEFFLPQIMEISRLIGQTPFDVSRMMYSQIVEYYLSKKAVVSKRIIPNQPKYEEIRKRRGRRPFTGGFVKEPKEGIYENISVLDFRSLYPTIIASHNISPETMKKGDKKRGFLVPEEDIWFSKKPIGFVSNVIKDLIEKRKEIKESKKKENLELREKALKITANATYGYFAYSGSKWYCFECAQASAAWGRFYIKKIIDRAEKEGFTVIYSDTDSVFITSKEIKKKTNEFLEEVNSSLPGIMELDLQGFYDRGIFVSTKSGRGAKKKYALIDDNGEMIIRGFETVRRDWCSLAKDVQRKVLRYVLENKTRDSINYVREIIEKIKKGDIELKEFVIHEQLTKKTEEYEQISPHVAAAKKMEKDGISIEPGKIIMFVITSGSGSISEKAEPFESIENEKIDKDYYINNQIIPAAMRVLSTLGVDENQLKGEGKQTGLKNFGA